MNGKSNKRAMYNYRYFLPHSPVWGTVEFCNKRLNELLDFCKKAKIDAVQFYVNTLPGTYYMPAHSSEEQQAWAAWMKNTVAPTLRERNISYQLNFQMLLGAHSSGLDMRDKYEWEFLVDQYGDQSLGCACPLGVEFRKIMGGMLNLWADTKPDCIWIDDDFRMHNHGVKTPGGDCDFYCYCDTHLAAFSEFSGKRYSREELVDEVLKSGIPSYVRLKWMEFLGDTMAETASWIRKEVQNISPETRLALMTSCPDVHSVEGRDWRKVLSSLCGSYAPITRPCSGIYTGTIVPPKDQTVNYRYMSHSISLVEQAFKDIKAEYAPELENTRFTTWCKSVRNSEYILVLGQLLGCPEITLSLNDLDASPISEEPTNLTLLRDNKPRLQTLADLDLRNWKQDGVVFISDPDSARKVQLSGNVQMQDMGLIRHWEDFLLQMGIPAFYLSPAQAAASESVVILEGYTAWCPSDAELEKILAGSVLLDAEAAKVLQERGFGGYIGVSVGERASCGIHAERYNGGILPCVDEIRVPHRGNNWYELHSSRGKIVSNFIDPRYDFHIGSTIYENELGGRAAVYAGVGDMSFQGNVGCQSHARLRWIHGILLWLSRNKFCALPLISHHGMTMIRKNGKQTLFAFVNFGTDAIENLKVRLPDSFKKADILDRSGKWKEVKIQKKAELSIIPCRLETFEWLVALLG